jgi:hypothetical protein
MPALNHVQTLLYENIPCVLTGIEQVKDAFIQHGGVMVSTVCMKPCLHAGDDSLAPLTIESKNKC